MIKEKKMKKKSEKKAVTKLSAKGKIKKKSSETTFNGGIKKQYLKTSPVCKVTFRLPKEAAPDARKVTIAGDFNNWNTHKTPLKQLKSGDFKVTLSLPENSEYRFRYLIDGKVWENDWRADKYVPNAYGCDDSVVIV
jgi:1,4-alpha-glucan branching enzyme